MELLGHMENGVVVLDGGAFLPEGTQVSVSAPPRLEILANGTQLFDYSIPGHRAKLPLVISDHPGIVALSLEELDRLSWDDHVSS